MATVMQVQAFPKGILKKNSQNCSSCNVCYKNHWIFLSPL